MTQRSTILVREPRGEEHAWIERQLRHWWGATLIVGRGTSIPLIGDHGIPVHDELEFELLLD
jgi:hypothetical protein